MWFLTFFNLDEVDSCVIIVPAYVKRDSRLVDRNSKVAFLYCILDKFYNSIIFEKYLVCFVVSVVCPLNLEILIISTVLQYGLMNCIWTSFKMDWFVFIYVLLGNCEWVVPSLGLSLYVLNSFLLDLRKIIFNKCVYRNSRIS